MKPIPQTYKSLLTQISTHYETARTALVEAYWRIGKAIVEDEQKNKSRADYGAYIISQLSNDLTKKYGSGFSISTLERIRRFYLTYQKSAALRELKWAHYVELMKVKDDKKRKEIETRIEKENLSSRDVVDIVAKVNSKESPSPKTQPPSKKRVTALKANRGKLFLYRIFENDSMPTAKNECLIDCGFKIVNKLDVIKGLVPGSIVRSVYNGGKYSLKKDAANHRQMYTYKAKVDRVVDGDTLKLIIDVGFGIWVREKVRLRSIDTPELCTPEGKKAKRFVERLLNNCECIVVKTYGYEKYARALADVFFLEGEEDAEVIAAKGKLLNQVLLDEGLAERF